MTLPCTIFLKLLEQWSRNNEYCHLEINEINNEIIITAFFLAVDNIN